MRAFIALVSALPFIAGQSPECSSAGLDAGLLFRGVELDFLQSNITANNLGGQGPNFDDPIEIRYSNIGTDFGDGTTEPVTVDLVVTNLTLYDLNTPIRNGRTEDGTGALAQVNLADDHDTTFLYQFVQGGTDIPVVFSTPFDFFFYDLDHGADRRLIEKIRIFGALRVTSIEEACEAQGNPSPCPVSTTVNITDLGGGDFIVEANERGVGGDNAESPEQILKPVDEMSAFELTAATRYVNVSYPAGISGFIVNYEITPSTNPGSSGRNFQYSVSGQGRDEQVYLPCFYCDRTNTAGSTCEPCGDQLNTGALTSCPANEAYSGIGLCDNVTLAGCVPGFLAYPACLSTCASECQADGCEEYHCFGFECLRCGNTAQSCGVGSACYLDGCNQGTAFDTFALCEAGPCEAPSPPPPNPPPPTPPPPVPTPPPSPPPPTPPPPSLPPPSPPPPLPPPPLPPPPLAPTPKPPSPSPPPPSPEPPPRPPPPTPPPPGVPPPSPPPPTPPPPSAPPPRKFVCFEQECRECGEALDNCGSGSGCETFCDGVAGFPSAAACETDGCDKYICHELECRLCGDAADSCDAGTGCFTACSSATGFPTEATCDAAGCFKHICYENVCRECDNAGDGCGPGSDCAIQCASETGYGSTELCEASPCDKFVCYENECRECGEAGDNCAPGSDCDTFCGTTTGFSDLASCQAAPCDKVVCYEQECRLCGDAGDECAPGSACDTFCSGVVGFSDKPSCESSPCDKVVCFAQECRLCDDAADECAPGSDCANFCDTETGYPDKSACNGDGCDKWICYENSCQLCGTGDCTSGGCLAACTATDGFATEAECIASPCDKFICFDQECRECGSVTDECGSGSSCDNQCDNEVGYADKSACDAAGCDKYVCYENSCELCGGPDCSSGDCAATCAAVDGFATEAACEASPCVKYFCYENECVECGSAGDSCAPGSACFTACDADTGFPTLGTCNAAGCEKHICYENECVECGSSDCNGLACLSQCDSMIGYPSSAQCEAAGCDKYVCFESQCRLCESATDSCEISSSCEAFCRTNTGHPTSAACDAAGCGGWICYDFECVECGVGACGPGTDCFAACNSGSPVETQAACEAGGCAKAICASDLLQCVACGGKDCAKGSDCFSQCSVLAGFPTEQACEASGSCVEYVFFEGACRLCESVPEECASGGCKTKCDDTVGFPTRPGCEEVECGGVGECDKYVCYRGSCVKCDDEASGCGPGTDCAARCQVEDGFADLDSCEAAGCQQYVCYDYACRECGSAQDGCAEGSPCYSECATGSTSFTGRLQCDAQGLDGSGCQKFVCEPEFTQQCFNCDSEYVRSLGSLGGHYCDDHQLFKKDGYNCQRLCNPPVARKDPHLYLPHGARADFRGAHNRTFAMLSAKDVAFNVKMEEADFNWAKRVVHGTKMTAAYWVVRTDSGKTLRIEYSAASKVGGILHEEHHRDVSIRYGDPPLRLDNVVVSMLEGKKLSVSVDNKWRIAAAISSFPFGNLAANKYKTLLDIEIVPLYDADHDVVAPHGIFGQAYDGDNIGVSGAVDSDRGAESTTTAQAEGAIEGTWVDYMLSLPFSTDFKYSRFNATAAKPRDVSKLKGTKTLWGSAKPDHVGASDLPAVA